MRKINSDISGKSFNHKIRKSVWKKANDDPEFDSFKTDLCGATIQESAFGTKDKYGWVIDHIIPVVHGGTDKLDNLQPLHWRNDKAKGNEHLNWECKLKE